MNKFVPWTIATLMAVVGFTVPLLGPKYFGLSTQNNAVLSGAMGGALVGAAGSLLAMLMVDWRQRLAAAEAMKEKKSNAKKLITAELVNIAFGLIASKRTMDIAIATIDAGGALPSTEDFAREMPRSTPLTDRLGADLLMLDANAIDALVTLKSNLERTGEGMLEITSGRRLFGLLSATSLSAALGHDMKLLAQCFELFAPERKFKLGEQVEPKAASEILRQFANEDISREKIGL